MQRIKTTVEPPTLCAAGCYHASRSERLERYLKRLRKELIVAVVDRKQLRIKLRKLEDAAEEKPASRSRDVEGYDRETEEQDTEVRDVVDEITRGMTR